MKSNREFDHIIREKMQGIKPSFVPESWSLLEQKMNAAEAVTGDVITENEAIDKLSYEKLHNYNLPFNKTHWQLMAGKLEREFYLIQELFRLKTMEASLMLLLLLTIARFLPDFTQKELPLKTNTTNEPVAAILDSNSGAQISFEDNSTVVKSPDLEAENKQIPPVSGFYESRQEKFSFSKNSKKSVPSGLSARGSMVSAIPVLTFRAVNKMNSDNPVLDIFNQNRFSEIHFLPAEILALNEITPLETTNRFTGVGAYLQPQKNIVYRIGMYGSSNVDRIVNAPTEIGGKVIPSLTRYALGYSGGISLGFGVDRLEIETGLIYTSKRYKPIEVQFVAGNVEKGFKNETFKTFEFNTLTVPLNIKYDFLVKNKWRLYAYAGGAIHFTSQAYYQVGAFEPSDDNRHQNSVFGGRNSVIEQLERGLSEGLFQGGGLRENTYLSVNGGLGFERFLGDRWSLFTQSNYQYTLLYDKGGLGPFRDVIHTFSVSTGLKVRMGGK